MNGILSGICIIDPKSFLVS